MSFRKPAALAGCCNLPPPSSPACHRIPARRRTARGHASAAAAGRESSSSSSLDGLPWPQPADPQRIPTPYEIFNQARDEPYSKRRFYELVKIYHPDRNAALDRAAAETSLERYRLVVAANSILSDPSRRRAYDASGQGWSLFRPDAASTASPGGRYTTFHRWRAAAADRYDCLFEDDPMYNATWEDWERWYERQRNPGARRRRGTWVAGFFTARGPQHTVFANNYVFVSIVFALAMLGGVGQATRAQQGSLSHRDRLTRRSEEASRNLMSARDEARADDAEDKGRRIRRWVRGRDDYGDDEVDGRADAPDGLCASGIVKDRDREPYWKRPPEPWER